MLVKDWGGGGSRKDVGEIDEAIVVAMSRNDGALNWGGGGWEGASYPVRLWEFLKDVKFKGMSLTLVMGPIGCRTPHNPPPTLTNIHLPLSSRPLLLISFPSLTQEWVSWEAKLSLSTRSESDWPTGNPNPQSENSSEWTYDPKAANRKWQ